MAHDAREYLASQFEIAWQLASYHLETLTTEECLWRPAERGLHLRQGSDGRWQADWPDHEGYDLGPPSIGWITWHMVFWWSMALDYSVGSGSLAREEVAWPGDADAVRATLGRLATEWRALVASLSEGDLRSTERTRWPFQDRPFGEVVGWATVELTKNAAELGYARFLHAVRR